MVTSSAPPLRGDHCVIGDAVYALAIDADRNRPGVAWWSKYASEEIGEPGEVVYARWLNGWSGGMGEVNRRISPNSLGFAYSEGFDCSSFGFARLANAAATVTPTTAPTDVKTYFFQEGTAITMVCGRYSWRMTISGTTITVAQDGTDFGANATAGPPAKFEGAWFVPLGGSVVFAELTTPATNVYTAAAANMYATAFTVANDGNVATLFRAVATSTHTHRIDAAVTAPRTTGNWTGGDNGATGTEVGDSTGAITNLVDTGIVMFVAKADGSIWRFDSSLVASRIPTPRVENTRQGTGLIAVRGTETAISNHFAGLQAIQGDFITQIGPDTMPLNGDIPNITLEPYRIDWYESAVASDDWVYTMGRVTEGGSTRSYVFAVNVQRGIENGVWYPFTMIASAAHLGFVDSSMRLWYQNGTVIGFWQLAKNGAPDAGRDNSGYGAASTTHRLFLPPVPFYRDNGDPVPNTLKQLIGCRAITRNVGLTCPVQVQVARDGASLESVGATITTGTLNTRYWDVGEDNDTCYEARFVLTVTTTSGFATTTDLQIHGFEAWAILKPQMVRVVDAIIDCDRTEGMMPFEIRSDLMALYQADADAVTVTDPIGDTWVANVTDVSDVEIHTTPSGALTYRLRVQLRERPNG